MSEKKLKSFFGDPFNEYESSKSSKSSVFLMDIEKNAEVPLKEISYEIEIIDNLALISLFQKYKNENNCPIETEFSFSVFPNTCFHEFEVDVNGDKKYRGKIDDKQIAKKEYENILKSGSMSAYSEINPNVNNIIKINIGNIPENSDILINFKYIQQLENFLQKFWVLTVPSCILNPLYDPNPYKKTENEKNAITSLTNPKIIGSKHEKIYYWDIKIKITSSSPIKYLKSQSHQIHVQYLDELKTQCKISFEKKEIPDKDFTLYYQNDEIHKPKFRLEYDEKNEAYPYCAMLNFLPNFNSASNEESYQLLCQQSLKKEENFYSTNISNTKGEYIFLIDRSGSMEGKRIFMAKQTLKLFLKSLPPNNYFNVVSFGDSHSFLFPEESRKYSEETVHEALEVINKFEANLGGTEILKAIKAIFKQKQINGYPKTLFLLTDGDVLNSKQVIKTIYKYRDICRVYTIGIGNCSKELIIDGAHAGKGKFEIINEENLMKEKIINLLNDALSPFLTDINLEYDKQIIEMVNPMRNSQSFLRKNESFTIFLFLNKNLKGKNETSIKLSYFDSFLNKKQNSEIKIIINDDLITNNFIHKYSSFLLIKNISWSIYLEKNYKDDVYIAQKKDVDAFCLDLALKYQILTPFTSFLCIFEDEEDKLKKISKSVAFKKVIVPSILSNDYNIKSPQRKRIKIESPKFNNEICYCALKPPEININYDELNSINLLIMEAANVPLPDEEDEDFCSTKMNKPNITTQENDKVLMEIVEKQKIEGFWPEDESIFKNLGLDFGKILDEKPKEINQKEIWITILILVVIEVKFQNEKNSLKLIIQKSKEYLEKNNINYLSFKDIALKLI